jgi:hypothetical protein
MKRMVKKKVKKKKKVEQVFTIIMESRDPYVGTVQENIEGKKAHFTSAGAQINFVAKNFVAPGKK